MFVTIVLFIDHSVIQNAICMFNITHLNVIRVFKNSTPLKIYGTFNCNTTHHFNIIESFSEVVQN